MHTLLQLLNLDDRIECVLRLLLLLLLLLLLPLLLLVVCGRDWNLCCRKPALIRSGTCCVCLRVEGVGTVACVCVFVCVCVRV
jgi:hypothetical protein